MLLNGALAVEAKSFTHVLDTCNHAVSCTSCLLIEQLLNKSNDGQAYCWIELLLD